jgi:hypothetical protein
MEISGWISWVIFLLTIAFIIREASYAKTTEEKNETKHKPFDPTKFNSSAS